MLIGVLKKKFGRHTRLATDFWNDTDGIILPYVSVILVVLVGFCVLALDGARYMGLQTQLQHGADALALAAAAELNQEADSITRANAAIADAAVLGTKNATWFGAGSHQDVTISSVRYLSSLPPRDQDPITAGYVLCTGAACTSDNALNARFVEVTVTPVSLPIILPASFFGGVNGMTAGAQAVAGFTGKIVCDVPPVFVCNPYETAGMTNSQATSALKSNLTNPNVLRREIYIRNDGVAGPGHFGWLVPPNNDLSASNISKYIKANKPDGCYSDNTVNLATGAKTSVLNDFNVRFDMGADPDNSPDINVRKGYIVNNNRVCSPSEDTRPPMQSDGTFAPLATTRALPFPEDSDAVTNPSFMKNGTWDCYHYWNFNHNPATSTRPVGCNSPSSNTISRYEFYKWENANRGRNDWSRGALADLSNNYQPNNDGETGAPLCVKTGIPNRRLIYVAVINCLAQASKFSGGATAKDVPVAGYAKYFMIRVVPETGTDKPLRGEFAGFLTSLDGARIINQIELYR